MDWQLIQQWAVCVFASLAIGSAVAFAEGLNVWAAGEGARINPLTGKAFEENPDFHLMSDHPVHSCGCCGH